MQPKSDDFETVAAIHFLDESCRAIAETRLVGEGRRRQVSIETDEHQFDLIVPRAFRARSRMLPHRYRECILIHA